MANEKEKKATSIADHIAHRVMLLEPLWFNLVKRPGKLLLIRPLLPKNEYTELDEYTDGSNVWAGKVKLKAVDEGWTVIDLNANEATREKIENAINTERPDLIMHYDHGAHFTLFGQKNDTPEPGLDESNIKIAFERIVSTVSCKSALGLGPTAIGEGVTSYLGYTTEHMFWTSFVGPFSEAANAANYALLECKTTQEAFDAGWAAHDQLYNYLLEEASRGNYGATFAAPYALYNRDGFTLLGSPRAVSCCYVVQEIVG